MTPKDVNDPHAYAEPNEAIVKHLNWTAMVDFENKQILGTANWDIETSKKATKIVFDVYGLTVSSVNVDGKMNSTANPVTLNEIVDLLFQHTCV